MYHKEPEDKQSTVFFKHPESPHRPSFRDTYSADFQKCPGWDSLRLSLGSFSSMSASWVKVGLSLRSYAQQADRISWRHKSSDPCTYWSIFKHFPASWYLCITRACLISCLTSRIKMMYFSEPLCELSLNSQWPPFQGWSPPRPFLCPLHSPPARWWLPRAGW